MRRLALEGRSCPPAGQQLQSGTREGSAVADHRWFFLARSPALPCSTTPARPCPGLARLMSAPSSNVWPYSCHHQCNPTTSAGWTRVSSAFFRLLTTARTRDPFGRLAVPDADVCSFPKGGRPTRSSVERRANAGPAAIRSYAERRFLRNRNGGQLTLISLHTLPAASRVANSQTTTASPVASPPDAALPQPRRPIPAPTHGLRHREDRTPKAA